MARRRRSSDSGNDAGTWLNTYADMVTLLLTFFAVMLSMSSVSEEKFNAFIDALRSNNPTSVIEVENAGTGGAGDSNTPNIGTFENLYDQLEAVVEANGLSDSVSLGEQDNVLYIKFNSSTFFKPDSYELRQEAMPVLGAIADGLLSYESLIKSLNISGHTAEVADENYAVSGWMLSSERASQVAIYMDKEKGFPNDKMMSVGYSSNFPVGDNNTPEGREENRRVEIMVIGNDTGFELNNYEALKQYIDTGQYPAYGDVGSILFGEDGEPVTGGGATPAPAASPPPKVDANVSPFEDES